MQESNIKRIDPPNPNTKEGYSSCFVSSKDKKWLAYCGKKSIILKNMDDLKETKFFNGHSKETRAVAFHPDGNTVVSADANGNLLFWDLDKLKTNKKIEKGLNGEINGLEFINEGKHLLIYGQGAGNYSRVIDWNTEKEVAPILGSKKVILCACSTPVAPTNFITCNEYGEVQFYSGEEYPLKEKLKGHDTGKFITVAIPYPDGTKFLTTGFDKKIITYDATTGQIIDQFDSTKIDGGHKMTIMSAAWIDDERLVTASLDKTVKIWNIKEKKVLSTLLVKDGKLDAQYKLCGVQTNGKKIYAVALNSYIYGWNVDTITDNNLPDFQVLGHKGSITSIVYCPETKEIISGDSFGLIIIWKENGEPVIVEQNDQNYITFLGLSCDNSTFYSLDGKGLLLAFDKASLSIKYKVKDLGGGAVGLCTSKKNKDEVYVASDNLFLIKNGQVIKKMRLDYKACALELNEELGEIYIGDRKGALHIIDMDFKQKSVKNSVHYGEYTVIKISPDGKLLASGDTQKFINVLDASTKEVYSSSLSSHSSRIYSLSWSDDSKYLASGSLDSSVYIYNMETKKKIKEYKNVEPDQVSQVCFANENKDIVTGGPSSMLKIYSFQ